MIDLFDVFLLAGGVALWASGFGCGWLVKKRSMPEAQRRDSKGRYVKT